MEEQIIERFNKLEEQINCLSRSFKRPLNFDEGCEYTGIKPSYMYKLTSRREIPHSKPGGKQIFFDREELDQWLLSNRVATRNEIESQAATLRFK